MPRIALLASRDMNNSAGFAGIEASENSSIGHLPDHVLNALDVATQKVGETLIHSRATIFIIKVVDFQIQDYFL
jgi:hypothetical protein